MTQDKNAKAEHVQYVNAILEQLRGVSFLEKFTLGNNHIFKRYSCERIVRGEPYRHHHEVRFAGPPTVKGLRDWLDVIEVIEQEIGLPAAIDSDSEDEGIYAIWTIEVQYTEEEKKIAQKWLDDNPKEEGQLIKFKKYVPFNTGETKDD